jgi:hypothetical protein
MMVNITMEMMNASKVLLVNDFSFISIVSHLVDSIHQAYMRLDHQ